MSSPGALAPRPRLVIVGGAPGSGKTTLSREIARRLSFALVAKDDVKEAVADVLGTGDLKRSRQLGSAAFAVMRSVAARSLEGGASLVFEANFHRGESEPWLRELAALAETRVVICHTTLEEYRRRFAARRRHPVHLDSQILEADWPPDSEFELDLGVPALAVDTTSDYKPDLETIMRFISDREGARMPR